VKVISPDGGIPEKGLKFLIEQAKRDAKITREVALTLPISEFYARSKRVEATLTVGAGLKSAPTIFD